MTPIVNVFSNEMKTISKETADFHDFDVLVQIKEEILSEAKIYGGTCKNYDQGKGHEGR